MKAVNLLPERSRPRTPTGTRSGSGYILLGVLGALLIALVVYVLTLNSINSTKGQIASANQQASRDNAIADELGAYGDFHKIKAQRVSSVMSLAQGRFDYERLMRELARLLPSGIWLTDANISASGPPTSAGGPASATSSSTSSSPGAGMPQLQLKGCAPSQSAVAVLLVHMRALEGATDATLEQSARPSLGTGTQAGGGAGSSCAGSSPYSFTADVTFAKTAPTPAPSDLGGGS